MSELDIKGLSTRRLPSGTRIAPVTSLDLVRREFCRVGPSQLWMTDITEHLTREAKVYCCVVLDAFSRLVVGWSESTQTHRPGDQRVDLRLMLCLLISRLASGSVGECG